MKYIFVLSVFLCLNSFGNETQKYSLATKTLFYIESETWVNYLRLIQNEEEIPPYFRLKTPSLSDTRILKRYNIQKYEKDLVAQLTSVLSVKDLEKANKILSNPFVIKVLQTLDYNYIEKEDVSKLPGAIHPKLEPLILSIHNILSHERIARTEHEYYRVKETAAYEANQILSPSGTVGETSIYVMGLGTFLDKYLLSFYNRLKTLSIPELREFVRITKDEKEFRKLNQILSLYHYSIIFKLRKTDEDIQEEKRKLGLDRD
jgi:hypothetical protein